MNLPLRLSSILMMLVAWTVVAHFSGPQMLPDPQAVAEAIAKEARSGQLLFNLSMTLWRVTASFIIAMVLGTAAGLWMAQSPIVNQVGDPWLVAFLNLPALVIIVLAYVWAGLTESAAIAAVVLNKLPIVVVTVREGARTLDSGLTEMTSVFRMSRWSRLRHVVVPQLAPYLITAARSGLSLVWKIVLVVELLGRPNGVGFKIGVAFQLFDVRTILAYTIVFVGLMLGIELILLQPFEQRAFRWRTRHA